MDTDSAILLKIEGTEDIAGYLKADDVLALMRCAKRQQRKIAMMHSAILAAVDAIERGSTSAPILECLRASVRNADAPSAGEEK